MNTIIRLRQPPGRTYTDFAKRVGITADEHRVSADFVKAFKRLEHEKPCYAHAQGGALHWWACVVRSAFASVEADPSKMDELSLMLYDYYSTTDAWRLVDEQINDHLCRLKQVADLKIAVTSNFDSRLHSILRDLGVSQHVDFIALSASRHMMSANGGHARRGAEISLESLSEWKIQEIGYDGIEKYTKPLEYKDLISKNARKVRWRGIVGSDATLDDTTTTDEEEEPMEEEVDEEAHSSETKGDRSIEPVAGPWAPVAKCLHQSLTEANALLDVLRVLKTQYVAPLGVSLEAQYVNPPKELIEQSKCFQWVTRRRALQEAAQLMVQANGDRPRQGTQKDEDKERFFTELRLIRQDWRIRKVNNLTFGDLGYRTFGPKFHPGELFDISTQSGTSVEHGDGGSVSGSGSVLRVKVPANLMRRTTLSVTIEKDNAKSRKRTFRQRDIEFMQVDPEKSKELPWPKALKWAQDTLIFRDIFNQLVRESVHIDRICLPTDTSLVVSLYDNMLLRVEQKSRPFEDGEVKEDGIPFLNRLLRHVYLNDKSTRAARAQQFVLLQQTTLPESLDLRGPQAFTGKEIESRIRRPMPLLNRLVQISSHYHLTDQVIKTIQKYMLQHTDPQFQWKWSRCSTSYAVIAVSLMNRGFESLGKQSFHIRISDEEVVVATKESQQIHCERDMKQLRNTVYIIGANHLLNSVALLSRSYAWQILHANNNAYAENGIPAPTLYLCNQNGTKVMFLQFLTNGQPPVVHIKKNVPGEDPLAQGKNTFVQLNSARIAGSSFLRKMDSVFAIFRN
ncbi:CBN-MDT-17 protein [Aphelenchoides avenae]|nr:CBN-MDT-17 protein [Aphelenchus avenae]